MQLVNTDFTCYQSEKSSVFSLLNCITSGLFGLTHHAIPSTVSRRFEKH
ncbi:Uncharacterised protein [Zhongshania aliphaticivorans]|uniref:Uncharacterized protein n=1 Tax=Zhongshania aliphaticivorans TaxID=1470434 RepID=A0A5S9NW26_9GAMM|nr:Uncharacterised protein [Zhongshania aliphaticivorans]CAA0094911.1 Uncharacterised protein [Zhongshania aliphaticivorans]